MIHRKGDEQIKLEYYLLNGKSQNPKKNSGMPFLNA